MVVMTAALVGACGGGDSDDVGTAAPTSTVAQAPATTAVSPPPSSVATTTPPTATPSPTTVTTRPAGPALTEASTLDLRGLGPVRVGMTLSEASAAAGLTIAVDGPSASPECSYAKAQGGPTGVAFMVIDGRIARADVGVGQASPVKTRSGAAIGDTEAQVQARYSNRLAVSPHKYVVDGHYLTFVPSDAADTGFRLLFETDGTKVTRFRAGKLPEVEYIEGCS